MLLCLWATDCSGKRLPGEACKASAECLDGLACTDGSCVAQDCTTDADCPAGDRCNQGTCACDDTDESACTAAAMSCGTATLTDGCGRTRSIECSVCPVGQSCVGGACACVGETDAELCLLNSKQCNRVTGIVDRCNVTRDIPSCGVCSNGTACTDSNTCACPINAASLCMQAQRECGALSTSACGSPTTVQCGTCLRGACGSNGLCEESLCGTSPAFLSASNFAPSVGFNQQRTFIAGVSGDGSVLLTHTAPGCSAGTPGVVARSPTDGFSLQSSVNDGAFLVEEEVFALSGDGRTIVGINATRTRFVTKTILQTSPTIVVSSAGGDAPFANLRGVSLGTPVWSGDSLIFIYQAGGEFLESQRGSVTEDFPSPINITADLTVASVLYRPEGLSYDGRTLFATQAFKTYVFVRPHRFARFVPLSTPNPALNFWRAKPLADCSTLFVTPNGPCTDERVGFADRDVP